MLRFNRWCLSSSLLPLNWYALRVLLDCYLALLRRSDPTVSKYGYTLDIWQASNNSPLRFRALARTNTEKRLTLW